MNPMPENVWPASGAFRLQSAQNRSALPAWPRYKLEVF